MRNLTFIYVAINESIPNMVKIGCTRRNPNDRMIELDTTGVPTPFVIGYVACVNDSFQLEKLVHQYLSNHRVREVREFFQLSVSQAIESILIVAKENGIEIIFEESESHGLEKFNNNEVSEYQKLINTTLTDYDDEKELFESLNYLDPTKIIKAWNKFLKLDQGEDEFVDFWGFDFSSDNQELYNNYKQKVKVLGNEDLDNAIQQFLPKLFCQKNLNIEGLFIMVNSLFQVKNSLKIIAIESLKRSKNDDEALVSGVLLYLAGLEDDAINVFNKYLPGYELRIKKGERYIPIYYNFMNILFVLTAAYFNLKAPLNIVQSCHIKQL